jgi:uncharacterized protein YukE
MAFGGDIVHYNYGMMQDIAAQIQAGAATAQALLEAANTHERSMLSSFHGSAADAAQACLATYKQAANDMIEVASRGHMNYAAGTHDMMAAEQQQVANFPL